MLQYFKASCIFAHRASLPRREQGYLKLKKFYLGHIILFEKLIRAYFVEMGPDPTRAYFWPTVNKRPTRLWLEYFLTWPEDIFFDPKGKNLKKLAFLREIFQTQTKDGRSDPTRATKIDPTWPGSKNFDLDPSLIFWLAQLKTKSFQKHLLFPVDNTWLRLSHWQKIRYEEEVSVLAVCLQPFSWGCEKTSFQWIILCTNSCVD